MGGDIFGIMLGLAVGRGWTMIRVEREHTTVSWEEVEAFLLLWKSTPRNVEKMPSVLRDIHTYLFLDTSQRCLLSLPLGNKSKHRFQHSRYTKHMHK